MRYLKTYNESFMDDYKKLSDDFEKAKTDFEYKRFDLWKNKSDTLEEIFYELTEYKNDFFNVYRSSTGGRYDNYLGFLENLFTTHYGDKDFYNSRLKNEKFCFSCFDQDQSKLLEFLDSCFNVMSIFGQLHESFILNLSIVWGHRDNIPLRYTGSTPTIPSEGMDDFIKNNLRKDDLHLWKDSLVNQVSKMRELLEEEKENLGFKALFYIQLK